MNKWNEKISYNIFLLLGKIKTGICFNVTLPNDQIIPEYWFSQITFKKEIATKKTLALILKYKVEKHFHN